MGTYGKHRDWTDWESEIGGDTWSLDEPDGWTLSDFDDILPRELLDHRWQ